MSTSIPQVRKEASIRYPIHRNNPHNLPSSHFHPHHPHYHPETPPPNLCSTAHHSTNSRPCHPEPPSPASGNQTQPYSRPPRRRKPRNRLPHLHRPNHYRRHPRPAPEAARGVSRNLRICRAEWWKWKRWFRAGGIGCSARGVCGARGGRGRRGGGRWLRLLGRGLGGSVGQERGGVSLGYWC